MTMKLKIFNIIVNAKWPPQQNGGFQIPAQPIWYRLWVQSPLEDMKYLFNLYFYLFGLVSKKSAALNSATQHAIATERSLCPAVCGIQREADLYYFLYKENLERLFLKTFCFHLLLSAIIKSALT